MPAIPIAVTKRAGFASGVNFTIRQIEAFQSPLGIPARFDFPGEVTSNVARARFSPSPTIFPSVFGDASSAACAREMADNADATPVSRRIFKFIMFNSPGQQSPKSGDFKREKKEENGDAF